MLSRLLPVAALPVLLLAACDNGAQNAEVITTNPDPMASTLANAAPVELPPSIKASATFRCKDSSVVSVDFLSDDKQANLKPGGDGTPVHLAADAAGKPLTGGGYTLTGTPKSITLTAPGKPAQTCKA
jgi:hypothetical protein